MNHAVSSIERCLFLTTVPVQRASYTLHGRTSSGEPKSPIYLSLHGDLVSVQTELDTQCPCRGLATLTHAGSAQSFPLFINRLAYSLRRHYVQHVVYSAILATKASSLSGKCQSSSPGPLYVLRCVRVVWSSRVGAMRRQGRRIPFGAVEDRVNFAEVQFHHMQTDLA